MHASLNGLMYQTFIDPLISGLRRRITAMIEPGETVIDIACGTGALAMAVADHARDVTGIDLSEDMIITARYVSQRKKIVNISFELKDAEDLSCYHHNRFDVAVTSLAMHQFDPEVAVKVLSEMKRIASRVIIADYNCPMNPGPAAWLAWSIERAARGDHYRNFRKFMLRGGIGTLAEETELHIGSTEVRGQGVFVIAQGTSKEKVL